MSPPTCKAAGERIPPVTQGKRRSCAEAVIIAFLFMIIRGSRCSHSRFQRRVCVAPQSAANTCVRSVHKRAPTQNTSAHTLVSAVAGRCHGSGSTDDKSPIALVQGVLVTGSLSAVSEAPPSEEVGVRCSGRALQIQRLEGSLIGSYGF